MTPIPVKCAQCGTTVMSDVATRSASFYYCSPEHKAKWIATRKQDWGQ